MKTTLNWKSGMKFDFTADGQMGQMDAKSPIGSSSAATPKELILAGLGGCTAMDVVALLKKHKQHLKEFTVDVDAEMSKGNYPTVFLKASITFSATGDVDSKVLMESVRLSQTKYCGVSAMLAKAFPISYQVLLNGEEIGRGNTDFSGH